MLYLSNVKLVYVGRRYREDLGLSQSQVAKICGVSTNTISSIETGQFQPTSELLFKLAIVLDRPDAMDLFEASGTEYQQYRASGIIDSYWCDKRSDDQINKYKRG